MSRLLNVHRCPLPEIAAAERGPRITEGIDLNSSEHHCHRDIRRVHKGTVRRSNSASACVTDVEGAHQVTRWKREFAVRNPD
jgi:hypothetical protein